MLTLILRAEGFEHCQWDQMIIMVTVSTGLFSLRVSIAWKKKMKWNWKLCEKFDLHKHSTIELWLGRTAANVAEIKPKTHGKQLYFIIDIEVVFYYFFAIKNKVNRLLICRIFAMSWRYIISQFFSECRISMTFSVLSSYHGRS